ncbi:hypothetical protein K458DRAFT_477977 [Lentithecium fluviatile CBS 122367]|uniref:Uncharacterized protein n=1 Tax=Lentithecium fluviatile CBS 122367 TaxID=1168545 RepID=A0A6G1J0Y7_9PLEO|nr:hypothetical protein K458DRAFT_477977 [Lentithecium fluviatile CBS 122367]
MVAGEDEGATTPTDDRASHLEGADGLKRARAIKAEISNSLSILQPKKPAGLRRRVEDDPENQLIKTLRQDHQMSWDAIANYLNEERLKRGEPANLTTPAVYSRFVRNGPRIASALGEVGFDPKDYMHLRNPAQTPSSGPRGGGLGFGIGSGRKRVRQEGNEGHELQNNMRKKSSLGEQARELEREDMAEMLVSAVANVERNFWTLVADEMERTSARLFDARACESRFHSI